MSPSTGEYSRVEKRKIRAEAAVWLARLHGPDRTPELEEGWRRWLNEHPLHAAEFELATDVWDESGGRGAGMARYVSRSPPIPAVRRLICPLAALITAAILVAGWFIHAGRDLQASTGIGEQKTLTLTDGSRITLNTSTRAVVKYTKDTRTVVLDGGEIYFDVVHNAARPFIVWAGDHKVIDLGTRFIVNRAAMGHNSLTVTVIQGQVAVAPIEASDTFRPQMPLTVKIVSTGQLLRIHPHLSPVLRSVLPDDATAWLHGQIIFDNTPLGEAAAEFNRYSPIKLKILSAETARIPVGGVFRVGDSASFARAVAESHHLRLVLESDELILDPLNISRRPGQSLVGKPLQSHAIHSPALN